MSETGEAPIEYSRMSPRGLVSRLKIIKNVALSGNYVRDVRPEDYEQHVKHLEREKLANEVASVVKEYVPTTRDDAPVKVLDIAAGTGMISRALKQEGYSVTAGDIFTEGLEAIAKRDPDIQTIPLDMNSRFELSDRSFDGVTTVWANRFIQSESAFLSEVHRILKPGGYFVWPIFPIERPIWKIKNLKLKGLGQHTNTASLAEDARVAGFEVVSRQKPHLLENLKTHNLPLHTTPGYLVLQKAS